ncbi:MAG: signal peptidase II [Solirubrobacteraceae bacterium]|nr:MAG: signal peptidase II [Solirubrobacterales bacterium]
MAATGAVSPPSRALLRAIVVVACVVALDQVTKALVKSSLTVGDVRHVFPGLELVDARNRGVAFGLFGGGHAPVIILIVLAVAVLLAYFLSHLDRPLLWLPTGLLMGGALGNLVDRVRGDAVVDFIKPVLWPAFNVADAAITVGIVVLLVVTQLGTRRG